MKLSIRKGRIITGVGCFLCLTVLYAQRVNINVIVNQVVTTNPDKRGEHLFFWTQTEQALVVNAFFFGYVLTQVIGGAVSDAYGPHKPLAVAVFVSSLTCIASPFAMEKSLYALIGVRIIMGAFQGIFLPATITLITNWYPPKTRATTIGLIFPGTFFGTILAFSVTPRLAFDDAYWRVSFYIFAGLGFLWMVLWFVFVTDNPSKSHWTSTKEKAYLSENVEVKTVISLRKFPMRKAMTSGPVIALIVCHFSSLWSMFLLVSIFSFLFDDLLYIAVPDQSYVGALVATCTWLGGFTFCKLSDWLTNKEYKKLKVRKILNIFRGF